MSKEQEYEFNTEYTLDKTFFAECYDQTSTPASFPKSYFKAFIFLMFGGALVEFELLPSGYVGWFFIVLSIVEACSVYFKRTWWLWRQRWSMSNGSKVSIKVDTNGLSYTSGKNVRMLEWKQIDQLEQSDLGFILHIGKQRQYVSKSCLSDEAIAFIVEQHEASRKA
ncbi:YcxB family protein [Vibrio mexicanus]|uniref:YcxB family protein n=1 Tax=Vibrio mexicanus TaxID=1004326 RepID=UPI00063BFFCF|nr:YcxB family protein [Vibrio mexicanus]